MKEKGQSSNTRYKARAKSRGYLDGETNAAQVEDSTDSKSSFYEREEISKKKEEAEEK